MFKLKENLKPKINEASFFPINTKDRKGAFDWIEIGRTTVLATC